MGSTRFRCCRGGEGGGDPESVHVHVHDDDHDFDFNHDSDSDSVHVHVHDHDHDHVTIRALTAQDIPGLAADLAKLPLMVRYGRDAAALGRSLSAALGRGESLLVAEDGGALLGLAWFLPTGTLALGGYLRLIAVAPGGEGRGTGLALLQAFEAETARHSPHAFLLVSDFNAGAIRFYEREGYTRVGPLPGLVLPEVAELLYWKRLR